MILASNNLLKEKIEPQKSSDQSGSSSTEKIDSAKENSSVEKESHNHKYSESAGQAEMKGELDPIIQLSGREFFYNYQI